MDYIRMVPFEGRVKGKYMPDFRYGPIEVYVVGFTKDQPDTGAMRALSDLLATGVVRLLDLLMVSKSAHGQIKVVELEDDANLLGLFAGPDPVSRGLISKEDLDELAGDLAPETSGLVLALELTYAKNLAMELAQGGGEVLRTQRIPAPVVNALVDLIEELPELATEGK